MVNVAAAPGNISPPPLRPHGSEAAPPQVLSGLGPRQPVIYASDLEGAGVKKRLVRRLLAGLPGQETDGPGPSAPGMVNLEVTTLGQPRLILDGQPGPAVSFSRAAGRIYAALTPAGQVGVDAAMPAEFDPGYPMARVFQPAELDWARHVNGGSAAGAAALLWALKEAAVKALGVGFHVLDPLGVETFSPSPWQGGWRVLVKAGRILPAWARPEAGGWLAIARYY
jgi:4'-phosphopantetheinyl transferase superfamily